MSTCGDTDDSWQTAGDYVVAVFPGEHDERTCAAGFLLEDHSGLAQSIHDPDVIDAVAARLREIAAEIRENRQREQEAFSNIVRGVDWGRHGPTQDL